MKQAIHIKFLFICILGLTCLTCYGSGGYAVKIVASKAVENSFSQNPADSLKKKSVKEIKPKIAAATHKIGNNPAMAIDSLPKKNTTSGKTTSLGKGKKPDQGKQVPLGKYKRWEKLVGLEKLQNVEIKLVEGAKPILPRSFVPLYVKIIDKAIRFPVILFFLMLIILLIMNAIVIMITLEISNTLKNKIDRYNELYQTMYERALTGYLFQEFDLDTAVLRMKKIHLHRNRRIAVSVLFNFQKNLSGDSDQKILEIFSRLSLNKDAIKKTQSHSFYRQILGLRELTNLYPSGAFPIVESHINDKNDELRAEAQTSFVRLNHEEPFSFMKNLEKPFTSWTQLTSFYIFRLHKLPAPSFVEYLRSDLYNVQNFSLRMITYFQQKENAKEIIKLLDAKRELTRFLAIRAINELWIHEAKPLLKERYKSETHKNQQEILKAMVHIGEIEDFDFLEKVIRGNDVTLKIEACRSMYFMNISGVENIVRLNEEKELNLQAYIAHIDDHRN